MIRLHFRHFVLVPRYSCTHFTHSTAREHMPMVSCFHIHIGEYTLQLIRSMRLTTFAVRNTQPMSGCSYFIVSCLYARNGYAPKNTRQQSNLAVLGIFGTHPRRLTSLHTCTKPKMITLSMFLSFFLTHTFCSHRMCLYLFILLFRSPSNDDVMMMIMLILFFVFLFLRLFLCIKMRLRCDDINTLAQTHKWL